MSDPSSGNLPGQSPSIDWNAAIRPMKSTPTLQVVVNPLLKRGSPIHDRAFAELRKLGAENVRFVPWFPYPRYPIAELYAPAGGKTNWDFSQIDPFTVDFLEATGDHAVTLNFSTIPPWMFKTEQPPVYPENPDQPAWFYQQGHELRDPSLKEVSDYFARLVSWDTQGGFTDVLSAYHKSGHQYKVAYWELLKKHFGPGGQVLRSASGSPFPSPYYHAQAFRAASGQCKLLLINKRTVGVDLSLAGCAGATAEVVDQETVGAPARIEQLSGESFRLPALAVAVLTLT